MGKVTLPRREERETWVRAAATSPTGVVLKAPVEKSTAKKVEERMAVASQMVPAIGVDTGFAHNLHADEWTSAWNGSVSFELKRTTLEEGEVEDTVDSANLESLEVKRGGWQTSCSLENLFAVLVNEDEEDHDDDETPVLQNLVPQDDNDWVHLFEHEEEDRQTRAQEHSKQDRIAVQRVNINGYKIEELFAAKDGRRQSLDYR